MRRLTFIVFCCFPFVGLGQTWSGDIAEIFYNKCGQCHNPEGAAPFSLIDYPSALAWSSQIEYEVEHGTMPPWLADPNYRVFSDHVYLTVAEKAAIFAWVGSGSPVGDAGSIPPPPVYEPFETQLDTIDYTVAIDPYTIQFTNEEYRWFVVPNTNTETIYINKLEVIPGLPDLIHHVDLSFDVTGISAANDALDPLPGFNDTTGLPKYTKYIKAWQPGGNAAKYPEDWGIAVPPGCDFVVEIHYTGGTGVGLIDTTKMNIQIVQDPGAVRPVQSSWMLTDSWPILIDGPLEIPPNDTRSFHQQTAPLTSAISVISICPHMHYIGWKYKIWAIVPGGDTIKMIDIPHWDVHWQRYYQYPVIQVLPVGTVIYSEGWYDNTAFNHDNPNDPPILIEKGLYSTDEMFLTYVIFANYQAGDENIILDSSVWLSIQNTVEIPTVYEFELFPNPVEQSFKLEADLQWSGNVYLEILNMRGEILSNQAVFTDGKLEAEIRVEKLEFGEYFVRWSVGDITGTIPFQKR